MPPGGEACNREDEDCDGEDDEGLGSVSCGLGVCRRTVEACRAGTLTACVPGAPSSTTDGCNGQDDDCDGTTDEDCASCIKVSPTGDDASAAQSNGATPFRSLQAAIDFADTHRSVSTRVCVAAGDACGASATYPGPNAAPLVMRNGISVFGNYEASGWTRCANSTTTIAPQTGAGVSFPAAVQTETTLDGFRIQRLAASTTAAVTATGARGVRLAYLVVDDAPAATRSYGVDLGGGSDAVIVRSRITSGMGEVESIAVRAIDSRVVLEENCATFDANGRCTTACGAGPGIRSTNELDGDTHHTVLLRNSPESRIERSAVCLEHQAGPGQDVAAIRVEGNGRGVVVRGSAVDASTTFVPSRGLRALSFASCGGETPWVVDNHSILTVTSSDGGSGPSLEAIHASGDCHPVVDANLEVANVLNGGPSGSFSTARGNVILCSADSGVASRCVVSGNPRLDGAGKPGSPAGARMTGVRCEAGSCAKISRNTIVAWRTHPRDAMFGCGTSATCRPQGFGVVLEQSGAFVDRNVISGGCSYQGTGVAAVESWSRIQNNRITGRDESYCGSITPNAAVIYGVQVSHGASGNELDLHSNSIIDLTRLPVPSCGFAAPPLANLSTVLLSVTASAPNGPLGILRNNDIQSTCGAGFREDVAAADPRFVQNNRIFTINFSFGLYYDDGTLLTTISAVNAMSDTTASGNVNNVLVDIGTTTGAPLWDIDGEPRDALPDIGSNETLP